MLNKIMRKNNLGLIRNFSAFQKDSYNNIPPSIWDLTKRKIYKIPNHPIKILIDQIDDFFTN